MPSWQARATSLYLRLFFKRRRASNEEELVQRMRAGLEAQQRWRSWFTPIVQVESVNDGAVRGEWIKTSAPSQATIYYLHGGGYVACSPATHRPFTATLARLADVQVFALDYRLAPENRFPAAVEDAVAGYRWLLAQGIKPQEIVIGGDSAGGGLTIATLVAVRDAGLPLPSAAFCLSPWADMGATGNSLDANDSCDPMFRAEMIRQCAPIYLGGAAANDPLASPIHADLHGLPPLLIYVSDTEVLLDDALRLAERARQGEVEVELRISHDLPHVWPVMIALRLPEARTAIVEIGQFIRAATASIAVPRNRAAGKAA
jgi:epsilon-lactone hydrolase